MTPLLALGLGLTSMGLIVVMARHLRRVSRYYDDDKNLADATNDWQSQRDALSGDEP